MDDLFPRLTAALAGRYAVEREIGSGGMALVFLADDLKHHRRVAVKVLLMLNGSHDHYFPVETSQRPFFRLLGTPPARKRQVIAEGGHYVPRNQLIAETLDWLDRYLGPVH